MAPSNVKGTDILGHWGAESCAADVMTDGSNPVRVGTLKEQVETALRVRTILRWARSGACEAAVSQLC